MVNVERILIQLLKNVSAWLRQDCFARVANFKKSALTIKIRLALGDAPRSYTTAQAKKRPFARIKKGPPFPGGPNFNACLSNYPVGKNLALSLNKVKEIVSPRGQKN